MNKLLATLIAGVAAFALTGSVIAADTQSQPSTQQEPTQQEQVPAQGQSDTTADPQAGQSGTTADPQAGQSGTTADPQAAQGADTTENPEYSAALKKCDSMSGAQKDKCIDSAKKKHGQM
jgi:ABC-type oligopeptide transport system substrate-binding subunit